MYDSRSRCITYEMSHGCGSCVRSTAGTLNTRPAAFHKPFSMHWSTSHAWRRLLASHTHTKTWDSAATHYDIITYILPVAHIYPTLHTQNTHTVLINSFSEATLSHSVYYATFHKPMIFQKALSIILFQSSLWMDPVSIHVAPFNNKKKKNISSEEIGDVQEYSPALLCFWLAAEWETPVKQLHTAATWCHELSGQHVGFLSLNLMHSLTFALSDSR